MSQPKPMLNGRELSSTELRHLKNELDQFDSIGAVNDEMRAVIEQCWPEMIAKIVPAGKR